MSAKRRTTALASGIFRWVAMASARRGFELPATSLIAPFLPAIPTSPPAAAGRAAGRRRDIKEPMRLAIRAKSLSREFFARRPPTRPMAYRSLLEKARVAAPPVGRGDGSGG